MMTTIRYALALACFTSVGTGAAMSAELKRCDCFQTKNIHEFQGVFLAGQPEPEGFEEAKAAGVRTIVNLRAASELRWDEKTHVERLGMKYVHVPIASPDALTDEVFEQLRKLFADESAHPLLVHCASAGRVGTVWMAHRVLDEGIDLETAIKEAQEIGLRNEEYVAKAKEYIERTKAKGVEAKAKSVP